MIQLILMLVISLFWIISRKTVHAESFLIQRRKTIRNCQTNLAKKFLSSRQKQAIIFARGSVAA